jgi:SAM-dependent MidA family methyltransferase
MLKTKKHIWEGFRPLSESSIWEWMGDFHKKQGIDAWTIENIPYFATSNSLIAQQTAYIVSQYLKDMNEKNIMQNNDKPLIILEVGAGSGRFGYLFLKTLLSLFKTQQKSFNIKYVMTDLAQKNIDFWKDHPQLTEFVASGHLDFACFNVCEDNQITTLYSGQLKTDHPMIVMANYLFDSLPSDLFLLQDGELNEVLFSWHSTEKKPQNISSLDNLNYDVKYRSIDASYEENPLIANILSSYQKTVPNGYISIPTKVFSLIENLRSISNNQLLMLTADKGDLSKDMINMQKNDFIETFFANHTTRSICVNFDAIGHYFQQLGGHYTPITKQPGDLFHCMYSLNPSLTTLPNTLALIKHNIFNYSIAEALKQLKLIQDETYHKHLTLSDLANFMVMYHYDSYVFQTVFPVLQNCIAKKNDSSLIAFMDESMEKIYDTYYFLPHDGNDACFAIAYYFHQYNKWEKAIEFYLLSFKFYGGKYPILFNLALCHEGLQAYDQALTYLNLAKKQADNHKKCDEKIKEIKEKI